MRSKKCERVREEKRRQNECEKGSAREREYACVGGTEYACVRSETATRKSAHECENESA